MDCWRLGKGLFDGGKCSRYGHSDYAAPKEIESIFPRSIMVGANFGTVLVRIEDEENTSEWQVTTLRCEEDYLDGRRPETVSFLEAGEDDKGIIEDLSRRDFTINSMAIGIDESLIDPHDGLNDLSTGTLRTCLLYTSPSPRD